MIVPLFHNYRHDTDEALMPLIQQKDERAFNELFRRYSRTMQGFFWRRTGGDETEAADLTQDVFLRVWERADSYNPPQRVFSWLFAVAYNLLTDHFRHIAYHEVYLEHLQTSQTDATNDEVAINLDKEQFDKALAEILQSLSEAEQLLFDLRFTQELSVLEIASILHVPDGTVKSRLHTLTNKLRTKLHQYE